MSKPVGAEGEDEEVEEPDPDEEPPEIPPIPVVLVATHAGCAIDSESVDCRKQILRRRMRRS